VKEIKTLKQLEKYLEEHPIKRKRKRI